VIDPCSEQWVEPCYEYGYDAHGNMVLQRDPLGRETKFTYDHLHNQTSRTLPGGATEYKEYDEFGRLYFAKDFKGQVTGFEYDQQGRLEYKSYYANQTRYDANDPNEVVEYIYDSLGRKTQVIDSLGTTTYEYDSEGNLLSVDSPQGVINYEYNPITGRKDVTFTTDTEEQFLYDEFGRLEAVNLVERNGLAVSEQFDYTYNPVGSRESLKYANGNYAEYEYDALNRLKNLTNYQTDQKTATLSGFTYTHYADGMRHIVTEDVAESRTITYTYDSLNRLLSESATAASGSYSTSYVYDLVVCHR